MSTCPFFCPFTSRYAPVTIATSAVAVVQLAVGVVLLPVAVVQLAVGTTVEETLPIVESARHASQQLQTLLTEGERLATVLQLAVKQHYGIRSEKLADFGMKPFRGLRRKPASESVPERKPSTAETATPPAITETTGL